MKTRLVAALPVLLGLVASTPSAASIPSPSEFLGMPIGADRTVADYRQIRRYFDALDAASPRLSMEILGPSTLGEELFMAVISSEENLANASRLREVARRLADPRGLSPAEKDRLVAEGKVVLLVTCNIHATEVGASQMAMEWAHALATADDPRTRRWLDDVVLLLLPSINPDGLNLETDWYRKHLGTKYEGGRMPWLYHPYVGHDNNRDWFMLTQKETRAVSRMAYQRWFPQVWLDEHQMGATGPRIFVPPYSEPVDSDIHPLVWRDVNLIGANMAFRLEQAKKTGVIYGYAFDAYWPGGTKNTAWWKNVSGLLTELASVRFATPVRVEPSELSGGGKGLIDYGPQTNFPSPWPGGWWRLRDIMDYERIVSDALLETCSERRADFLRNALTRAEDAIAGFPADAAFRIPGEQRDRAAAARLAALLDEHGVELRQAQNGDVFVPLAQPYGRFVDEMLSVQRYPEVKLVPGREVVRPYDVSAWTLPLMMGVAVERSTLPDGLAPWRPAAPALPVGSAVALAPTGAETARLVNAGLRAGRVLVARTPLDAGGRSWPAGTVFLDAAAARAAAGVAVAGQAWSAIERLPEAAEAMSTPRVGLYKPWAASMDEGWTRFVLEQYGFAPVSLDNATVRSGGLRRSFDAIVLPDVAKEVIATGKPKRDEASLRHVPDLPPDYRGGLEKEGAAALKQFVEDGGTLIALASSAEYVIDELALPVRAGLPRGAEFEVAGALLQVEVTEGHPATYGLPPSVAVFQDEATAFATTLPDPHTDRWVLARYPRAAADVLLSGWARHTEDIAGRAAAVALTFGKGRVVLLGFRAQHRAQTPATFPFLFDALHWSTAR